MTTPRLLIAIVDDEESVRVAMKRLMRSAGLNVETFPSGVEFLAALQTHRPDCVVLDLHMPLITGFEVQSHLAKRQPRVPVVVITGHDTPEARARALEGGAAAYLLKPVDDCMLLDAITAAVNSSNVSPTSGKQP
jgi:FixJ family two-component response regulator